MREVGERGGEEKDICLCSRTSQTHKQNNNNNSNTGGKDKVTSWFEISEKTINGSFQDLNLCLW